MSAVDYNTNSAAIYTGMDTDNTNYNVHTSTGETDYGNNLSNL